jgi:sugar lactone lactonase YvrE
MYTRQKEQYEQIKDQFAKLSGATPSHELTDKEIDERVKSSMEYKLKASSISALNDDVFLATHATAGYGFEVWRMDDHFENAGVIAKDLSGCCGQMDVKANKDGVFVAENSQHRVCRFDRDGKSIAKWGQSARTGLEGFGSCCNPMNVAFGPNDAIYTAEDDTGRIKRYSVDGKLLGLVGAVELKPGCKNCSISVSADGSRVYMLDITRNLIIRLDARPTDEVATDIEKMKVAPPLSESGSSESGASIIFEGIRSVFSSK